MTNRKTKQKPIRMNLEMRPEIRDRLERLSDETGMSLSEVVRKSLAVFDLVWCERQKGRKIVVRDEDGERKIVILW